ncbi:hypothetical protein C8J57DRAFT_70709 [Mycena rebaudengoi]|nr:hypothetical protein C8J57DRAFT_70709 [Mycena rebaudengoi]
MSHYIVSVSRTQEALKFVDIDFYLTRGGDPATILTLAAICLLVTFLNDLLLRLLVWFLHKFGCRRRVAKDVLVKLSQLGTAFFFGFNLVLYENGDLYTPLNFVAKPMLGPVFRYILPLVFFLPLQERLVTFVMPIFLGQYIIGRLERRRICHKALSGVKYLPQEPPHEQSNAQAMVPVQQEISTIEPVPCKSHLQCNDIRGSLQYHICLGLLRQPYVTSCGHAFDLACLQLWFCVAPPSEEDTKDGLDPSDPAYVLHRSKFCPLRRCIMKTPPTPLFIMKAALAVLSEDDSLDTDNTPFACEVDPWRGIFYSPGLYIPPRRRMRSE